ncbi:MAG: hypothetical protein Q9175_006998 [Cornicularia normoerica]
MHILSRTEGSIGVKFQNDREDMDGVGGPELEYWRDYFENEDHKTGPGNADANDMDTSDTPGAEQLPALEKNQQASVDAWKWKAGPARWSRGKLSLNTQPEETVTPQTRSANTSSIPRLVEIYTLWKQEEDQLLGSLRESGETFAEIATQVPNRSVKSCRMRWKAFLRKRQGPRTKQALPWEEWEERLLVSGYYAGLGLKEISTPITGRTLLGSRDQWMKYFRSSDQDELWTAQGLALLVHLRWRGSGWVEISQEVQAYIERV